MKLIVTENWQVYNDFLRDILSGLLKLIEIWEQITELLLNINEKEIVFLLGPLLK